MSNLFVSFTFSQSKNEATVVINADLKGHEDEEPVKNFLSGEKTPIESTIHKWVTEGGREYGMNFYFIQSRDFFLYVFRNILSPKERNLFNENLQLSGDDGCPCILKLYQAENQTSEEIEILRFIVPKITPMKGGYKLI